MGLFDKKSSTAPVTAEGTKNLIIQNLRDNGVKFTDVSKGSINALRLGFGLENCKGFELFIFVDSDGESYQIRSGVIMSVPDDKRSKILEVCNSINCQYRWLRFYVDSDNDLMAQEDIDFFPGDEEKLPALSIMRAASIYDDAYPEFMKAQWA